MLLNDIARQSVIDAAEELYEARKYLECGGSRRERIERAELEFERSVRALRRSKMPLDDIAPLPWKPVGRDRIVDVNGDEVAEVNADRSQEQNLDDGPCESERVRDAIIREHNMHDRLVAALEREKAEGSCDPDCETCKERNALIAEAKGPQPSPFVPPFDLAPTEGRRTAAVDTSGSAASLGDPRLDSRRPWD